MKPSILLQLDTDPQPSVFDSIVAIDSDAEHVLRHGQVTPEKVRDLVHGALFTRGPSDLHRTAIFVGGSDVSVAAAVLEAIRATFFGPFRVSVLLDPNGSNTTAAAAVLAVIDGAEKTLGAISGAHVAVLGATGPVGGRVARLLLGLDPSVTVSVGSRRLDRAHATVETLKTTTGRDATPFSTADSESLAAALDGVDVVVTAGAAGACLLPFTVRQGLPGLKVGIDLNAVPPLGIEGIEATDQGVNRDGLLAWAPWGSAGRR